MLLTVGHLTDGSLMSSESLDRRNSHIAEDIFVKILILEVGLDLILHVLLRGLLFGIDHAACGIGARALVLDLLLAQVPEMDLAIVDARGQLVDIGQVLEALDEVIDEPGRVLRAIRDVLLSLLVSRHFLLFPAIGALHRLVLIRHVVRISGLRLVIEREEELYVPCEDSTLRAS